MIDSLILPTQRRLLQPPAQALSNAGISADMITVGGFLVGILAVPLLAASLYIPALVVILMNRFADGLDGAVARIDGQTDRGAFIDIAFDFLFYALVPLGFALADPQRNALPAAFLIASFVGTGSSFLAFSIIAAKRGLTAQNYPQKGIYYLGGLTEGSETIAFFIVITLMPQLFSTLAYVFAALCLVTTLTRWWQGWNAFQDKD